MTYYWMAIYEICEALPLSILVNPTILQLLIFMYVPHSHPSAFQPILLKSTLLSEL